MTPKPPRPGAHGEGIPDASHAYVIDLGPTLNERAAAFRLAEAERPQPQSRIPHRVYLWVDVMARNPAHAKTQAATMTVYGFGARANFEVLKVEAPDEH